MLHRIDRPALGKALSGPVVWRSLIVAAIVGTILNLINQGADLLAGKPPHLLRLAAPEARDAMLRELVQRAESQPPEELKRLVFAAIMAGLADAPPLRAPIEAVFAEDATLQAIRKDDRDDARRVAREIGALLAHAEKYRCNECGFAGRSFYWHCPACHAWDSFEPCAIVKLG